MYSKCIDYYEVKLYRKNLETGRYNLCKKERFYNEEDTISFAKENKDKYDKVKVSVVENYEAWWK